MQYKKESCVICLDDPKQAALYYDRVVPVTFPYHGHGMSPEKYVHNFTNLLGENLHCDIKTVMSISEQIWNLIPINTSLLAAYKQEPCSYVQWVEKTFGFTHSNKVKDYCKSMDKLFSEVEINETKFPASFHRIFMANKLCTKNKSESSMVYVQGQLSQRGTR